MSKTEPESDLGPDFTLLELLQEIQAYPQEEQSSGLTVQEMAVHLGWSAKKVRRQLHKLKKQGRLRVSTKTIINLAGKRSTVPAYSIRVKEVNDGER